MEVGSSWCSLPSLNLEEALSKAEEGLIPALGLTRLLSTSLAPATCTSRGRCSPGNELPKFLPLSLRLWCLLRELHFFFTSREFSFLFVTQRTCARFSFKNGFGHMNTAGFSKFPHILPGPFSLTQLFQLFQPEGHRHSCQGGCWAGSARVPTPGN